MMNYVALDFKSGLADASLAQFATNILMRLKGDPRFSALKTLVETNLQPACDQFTVSLLAAADRSRTKIAEKRIHRRLLVHALEVVATQPTILPDTSESMILEAGFDPRQRVARNMEPGQVQGSRARSSAYPGEVRLEFERVPQARGYGLEWSSNAGAHWNNGTYSIARYVTISGLPTRQDIWFRVTAIGTQQRKGAPSVPVVWFVV